MRPTRRVRPWSFFVVVAVLAVSPRHVTAQEDFRSLDPDRPLHVTDAYPKKYMEWEFQVGLQGTWTEAGRKALGGLLELETGLFRNLEIGAGLEVATEDEAGVARTGIESVELDALYNFNHESWAWPAVAVQISAEIPVGGDLSRDDWAWGADLILTRSFASRLRLHANSGYVVASRMDDDDYWRGGLAFDIPMGFGSRILLGDLYTEIPVDSGRTRVWAELGTRIQVSNVSVFDLGLTTRLDEWDAGAANLRLVIGLSRVFGIGAWVDVPEYPNPRIR